MISVKDFDELNFKFLNNEIGIGDKYILISDDGENIERILSEDDIYLSLDDTLDINENIKTITNLKDHLGADVICSAINEHKTVIAYVWGNSANGEKQYEQGDKLNKIILYHLATDKCENISDVDTTIIYDIDKETLSAEEIKVKVDNAIETYVDVSREIIHNKVMEYAMQHPEYINEMIRLYIKNNIDFTVEQITVSKADAPTFKGNTSTTYTLDVSKDGYTALGVVGFDLGTYKIVVKKLSLLNNKISLQAYSTQSADYTNSLLFSVIYKKGI